MENLRWILGRVRPYIFFILLSILGSIAQSAGTASITFIAKAIVDDVFVLRDSDRLYQIIGLFIASAILMQGGMFFSRYMISIASERVLRNIREEIFRRLLFVPYSFFIRHPSGDLISRIVSDVDKVRQILVDNIPTLLREPIVAIVLIGILLYRDIFLTLLLVIVLPIMSFAVKYFGGKKGKHVRMTQEGTAELTQTLSQTIQGIENIKVFSVENKILEAFKRFNQKIYRSSVKAEIYIAGNSAFNYISGYVAISGVFLYGGYRIVEGSLSAGDFISYIAALFLVQPHILHSQKALMDLRGTLPIVARLRELLSLEQEDRGRIPLKDFREKILFQDTKVVVGDKEILKGINIEIRRGMRIGIVGHTGSGKSTLVKIIPRLVEYRGHVFIDDQEIKDLEITSLRSRVGMATQEVFLLNASIRENLLIAKPDATEEELKRALDLALCDFVYRLEKGLDSVVGERGYTLSGGERQRLSLARLFLKNPEIVILDEATSALDMKTEKKVLENLFEFFKGKTMLIVAHRLSNVMECDTIIVMKNGELVEQGSFHTLVERKGEFFRIFKEGKLV